MNKTFEHINFVAWMTTLLKWDIQQIAHMHNMALHQVEYAWPIAMYIMNSHKMLQTSKSDSKLHVTTEHKVSIIKYGSTYLVGIDKENYGFWKKCARKTAL